MVWPFPLDVAPTLSILFSSFFFFSPPLSHRGNYIDERYEKPSLANYRRELSDKNRPIRVELLIRFTIRSPSYGRGCATSHYYK